MTRFPDNPLDRRYLVNRERGFQYGSINGVKCRCCVRLYKCVGDDILLSCSVNEMADLTRNEEIALMMYGKREKGEEQIRACNLRCNIMTLYVANRKYLNSYYGILELVRNEARIRSIITVFVKLHYVLIILGFTW